tara:strand:- start:63 stop:263 length:201 start_codon:yes stop_codon:yes gene_type:complete
MSEYDRSIEGHFLNEGYGVTVRIIDAKAVEFVYTHNDQPMTTTWVEHNTAATLVDNLIAEGYIRYG